MVTVELSVEDGEVEIMNETSVMEQILLKRAGG